MPIVALCGQKGGTGKTTTALSVAAELRTRDRRVLVVDADPQGSARTWGSVAAEAGRSGPVIVAMGAQMHTPGQIDDVARAYDFTVIDCPPSNGSVQRSALMACDLAVFPCGPSALDAWALAESLELVQKAQEFRPALRAVVLITRRVVGTTLGAGARETLSTGGLRVLRSELCHRIAYQEAIAAGRGVTDYAPNDAAATEVRALVDELLKELPNGKANAARPTEKTTARRRR
jgi:chromosome partitioning protein